MMAPARPLQMVKPAAPMWRAHLSDPRALLMEALSAFNPPEVVTIAEHATAKRWLANTGGGYVGRWQHAETPYLVAPMEALTDPRFATVAVAGPAQCGKTEIAQNWMHHSVDVDPADFLWYMQSEPALESFVKQAINPMIDLHDETMKAKQGLRPVDDSLGFKRFRGMSVQFLTAAPNNFISKRAPRLVLDEVDAYAAGLGDVPAVLDLRRITYGDASTMLLMSHADRATSLDPRGWNAGIMKVYGQSDRRLWYWPCPECNGWSSPNPAGARVMAIHYDPEAPLDEIEQSAALLCPCCGCLIADKWRRSMNAAAYAAPHGGWIAEGQTIDEDGTVTGEAAARAVAGFWIVGAMSTLVRGGIGTLARARVAAERAKAITNDDAALRTVIVKQWGHPYEPARVSGTVSGAEIAERAEPALTLGIVPDGVRFLTAFVDVQGNRFELMVRGWGDAGESWLVALESIDAQTSTDSECWDSLLNRLAGLAVPLADGSGRTMRLLAAGYDSGGAPGVTMHAYAAWRRARAAGKIRRRGAIDGRECWSIIPMKGLGGPNAGRLATVRPNAQRKDRKAGGGDVPVAQFNANAYKNDLAAQLATIAGAFGTHFPASVRSMRTPHLFFEGLVSESPNARGEWKPNGNFRNEPLDQMVGTHVIAELHGLHRIKWNSPPGWAAEWDKNTMISAAPTIADTAIRAASVITAVSHAPVVSSQARPSLAELRRKYHQ
jgi:phage terminase large subunit GpA-like protein